MCSEVKVAQLCPTLCDPMDSTVHGILQVRILEWVVFPFPGDLPNPGTESPALQADSLPSEPQGNPKFNIQKMKIMSSTPITLWQIDEETRRDFLFGGSKITADCNCSHEIKRHLPLGRKAMTKLNSILKSRDITLLTKVCLIKAMAFPVVMYGCESRTISNAEHQRIEALTVVLEKTLKGFLDYKEIKPVNREGNQSWVFIGRTDAKAKAPILWPPDAKD